MPLSGTGHVTLKPHLPTAEEGTITHTHRHTELHILYGADVRNYTIKVYSRSPGPRKVKWLIFIY